MKAVSGQAILVANACEVDLTPPGGFNWLVMHMSVFAVPTTSAGAQLSIIYGLTCSVFLNNRYICGTNQGQQDSADGAPIPMHAGDVLRFIWASAITPTGITCYAQMLLQEDLTGSGLLQSYGTS